MAAREPPCQGEAAMAKTDEEREQRLAEALRENLKRRKAQARGEAPPRNGEGDRTKCGGGGPVPGK
jgi:hypothetical protein